MVELHQWWDIYCHHWSEFFTARNFSSHMWESYQAMKRIFWVCHSCQAWLNCTSSEICNAITGRSSSLLGILFLYVRGLSSNETVILSMLPSMFELHQWWHIYCHHWSEFFTARNFGSLMWEAYQAMKQCFWVRHCCLAWLNCTSGEIFNAITGRSSSLLGTLFLLCERLIKQWNSYSEYVAKHGLTAPVVRYLLPSMVGVLHC
jgi:hypothetical protein